MDQFTQRMLERARARQEKIDQKLASSGQTVPKRKPLTENIGIAKTASPVRSPSKGKEIVSPKKSLKSETPAKVVSRRPSIQKDQNAPVSTPHKTRNDVVVTKKEFGSPRGSIGRRNSDVSLEINITHRNDIKVDVQIEEYETPITVIYNTQDDNDSNVVIKEIEEDTSKMPLDKTEDSSENKNDRAGLRHNFKSRLDRLGNLYSDKPLSSPIHRTEQDFTAATPPAREPGQGGPKPRPEPKDGKRKFGRLAALADQINNWEDDLSHHTYNPEPVKKTTKAEAKHDKFDSSTLDVSIHSINDINTALQKSASKSQPSKAKSSQASKTPSTRPSTKPSVNECQRLKREIVAELEGEGYRRVSASKSRLVYDFTATKRADPVRQEPKRASTTPSAASAPNMATLVASAPPNNPAVTKKPSLKKYRAPTPPHKTLDDDSDRDKDKENNVIQPEENDNDASDCIQTKQEPVEQKPADRGSPVVRKLVPKLNGNVDRSSVLSKAAMFEAGSPRNKDPAEMSLRERKALFEKNKGAAIIPKAPFGMAPSVKTLHGDNKADNKTSRPASSAKTTPTKSNNCSTNNSRANSKDNLADDNISQSSVGGGIKGKLAALFSKEQTISETTIANKFKQEREKEMEMLQNRFHYKINMETMKQTIEDLQKKNSDISNRNVHLEAMVASLEQRIQEIEQQQLSKCIEISNVPELPHENLPAIAEKIAKKLKQPVDNIINVTRLEQNTSGNTPGIVQIELKTENVKLHWLKSARKAHILVGDVISNAPKSVSKTPIILKEALTTLKKNIIWQTRQELKDKLNDSLSQRGFVSPKQEQSEQQNNESDDDQSDNDPSEKAPLMGSSVNLAAVAKKPEIIANVPKVSFDDKARKETEPKDREDKDKVVGSQPVKRRSSQDSPVVLSVLEDVKRIKVNNNKKEPLTNLTITQQPSLYPHLSDIETDTSHTQEEYSDCGGSSTDDNLNDKLNKSDDWAETSFGREVMNVVKKNNTSYKKAVRESDSDSSEGACDSELDDVLDEALNHEGPTPPKVNKGGVSASDSFVYEEKTKFKSPQKPAALARLDRGNELVHSVSFYRRMQNASSTPTTPVRVVRHTSPERSAPTPEPPAGVTTVRQRIKELQQEVAKQQTVISQASQALNLCAATIEFSGSTEQAEGERLLLLATHRRQACLHEIQRLQVEGAGPAATAGMAALHIHSLSVPLRRDYVRQLNADGAVGHHAVCLLKCRDRVLATSMQLTQPSSALLHFPDEIRMDGLTSDFKVTVEVYLLQASKEILPHEVKYHISNKKGASKLLTPKGKVSELRAPRVQSPAGPLAVRSPQLAPHGYCIFALPQASRKTFTLNKVPCGSPLEGSVNLDIKARLRVEPPAVHAAFLTAFDDVSGMGAWHRRWFRLQAPTLSYWKYPDDVQKKLPIGDIDLSTVVSARVERAPRELCARPHTLLLESAVPAGVAPPPSLVYVRRGGALLRRHLLAADTQQDRDKWLDCLNQALEYVRCCSADDE